MTMKELFFKHIILIAFLVQCGAAIAQTENENQEVLMPGETPKPTKYIAVEEQKQKLVFFQGFTLSVDAFGPLMSVVSDYGTIEAALRLNLKNTFLPIVELGYGKCNKTDDNTNVSFKTNAPFARIGMDINMLKNKFQDNRLYLGARVGVSKFNYEISGPEIKDPIWGGSKPFDVDNIDCTSTWGEIVFGAEVKIYKNFHMGWLVRYKSEFSSSKSKFAKPSCIPGYGYTTNSTCWGGTYSLIFDLNWGMKKSRKAGYNIEIRDINYDNNEQQNGTVNESESGTGAAEGDDNGSGGEGSEEE